MIGFFTDFAAFMRHLCFFMEVFACNSAAERFLVYIFIGAWLDLFNSGCHITVLFTMPLRTMFSGFRQPVKQYFFIMIYIASLYKVIMPRSLYSESWFQELIYLLCVSAFSILAYTYLWCLLYCQIFADARLYWITHYLRDAIFSFHVISYSMPFRCRAFISQRIAAHIRRYVPRDTFI